MSALNELDLSGLRVVSLRLTIPLAGAWVADVELTDDTTLPPGPLTLSVGNLSLVGVVVRQDSLAGSRQVRLVGGAGGWAKVLGPQSYHDDGGIPRATPLRDLAALTGETIFPADLAAAVDVVGVDYVREAAPAARTLEQLAGEQWWIDPLGMTHLAPRVPGAVIATPYLVQEYDGAKGLVTVSTEDWASFVPGAVLAAPLLDQPMTLVDVSIVADGGDQVRIEALVQSGGGAPPGDRVLGLLRAIIRHEIRALTFAGIWEYQVTSSTVDAAGRTLVDGLPLAPGASLPPLRSAEVRPGVPGLSCAPADGSRVLVAFANQSPARPVVVGFDSAPATSATIMASDSAGLSAPILNVGNGGFDPVALANPIVAWMMAAVLAVPSLPPVPPNIAATKLRTS